MKLQTYVRSLPKSEREAFALRCNTSVAMLTQIGYGYKKCSETLALALERESGGLVAVADVRPAFAGDLARSGYVRIACPVCTAHAECEQP